MDLCEHMFDLTKYLKENRIEDLKKIVNRYDYQQGQCLESHDFSSETSESTSHSQHNQEAAYFLLTAVMFDGTSITGRVCATDTIGNMRERICSSFNENVKSNDTLTPNQIRLLYDHSELKCDTETLKDIGIVSDAKLYVVIRPREH